MHQQVKNHLEIILDMWEKLGVMEREVLSTLALRLYAGQRKYGKLEENKKPWTWETAEEAMDASVYLAAEMVRVTKLAMKKYESEVNGTNVGEQESKGRD